MFRHEHNDKCKYIDFRNIINFQIHLLFSAAGLLQDKGRGKGPSQCLHFSATHCSKTRRFQNSSER